MTTSGTWRRKILYRAAGFDQIYFILAIEQRVLCNVAQRFAAWGARGVHARFAMFIIMNLADSHSSCTGIPRLHCMYSSRTLTSISNVQMESMGKCVPGSVYRYVLMGLGDKPTVACRSTVPASPWAGAYTRGAIARGSERELMAWARAARSMPPSCMLLHPPPGFGSDALNTDVTKPRQHEPAHVPPGCGQLVQ